MKKKKIVSQFFNDAKFNELISLNKANVKNEKISKNLEFDTKTNYDRMLHFWNEWIFVFCFDDFVNRVNICWKHFSWVKYERRNVDVNSCDLKTAKHFMKNIVRDYKRERLCILCFKNERILMLIENDDLIMFKSFLKSRNLFTSFEFLTT
jgi:hypothetical protein